MTTRAALRANHVLPSRTPHDATAVDLGVDPVKFSPLPTASARAARKLELGFPPDVPLVMYLGRFSPEKRLDTLLQAAVTLFDRPANFHVAIVGGKRDDLPASILSSFPSFFEQPKGDEQPKAGNFNFTLVEQTDEPDKCVLWRASQSRGERSKA